MINYFKSKIFKRSKKFFALSLAMLSLSSNLSILKASEPNFDVFGVFGNLFEDEEISESYDDSSSSTYEVNNDYYSICLQKFDEILKSETNPLFMELGARLRPFPLIVKYIANRFNNDLNEENFQLQTRSYILNFAYFMRSVLNGYENEFNAVKESKLDLKLDSDDPEFSFWRLFVTGIVLLMDIIKDKKDLHLYEFIKNTHIRIPEKGFEGLKHLFTGLELQLKAAK